ncbi:MAG: hypothetical protein KGS72_04200 [Cyanobacteria bacterium REEB67]|nr:hypothetical protein [Cyanobacteria bacterium REEB67]
MSQLEHANLVDSGREIGLPEGVHRCSREDVRSFLYNTAGQIKEETDKLVSKGSLPAVDIHPDDGHCFGKVTLADGQKQAVRHDTAPGGHGDPHHGDKHHAHPHPHVDAQKVLKVAERVAPFVLPALAPGLAPLIIPGLKHHNPLHKLEHEGKPRGKNGAIHNALSHMHLKA